jgi:hypothetical protein
MENTLAYFDTAKIAARSFIAQAPAIKVKKVTENFRIDSNWKFDP